MNLKTRLFLLLLGSLLAACAPSLVVNSEGDEVDANLNDGVCATVNNECTLRAAIQQANADAPGATTITFENVSTISPVTTLDYLVGGGTTINGEGNVTLNGAGIPGSPDCSSRGLTIWDSSLNKIQGLTIINFGTGIEIYGPNGDAKANIIGADPSITAVDPATVRNVIGGNCWGIIIRGQGAFSNTVAGNYIGTNGDGITANPNNYGIVLNEDTHDNLIGSTFALLSPSIGPSDQFAYWNLDEAGGNRADSVGANTLVETSGAIASTPAVIEDGADFEAADSEFFEVADNADLSTGDIDFTFAGWVRLESKTGSDMQIVSKQDSASNREFRLYFQQSANRFVFQVFNNSGSVIGNAVANQLGSPTLGTWYFIVAWHDSINNEVGIQVNNGAANTAATTGVITDKTATFRMGAQNSAGSNFWDGVMDEWGFWKSLLTSQEIAALYNNGNGYSYPLIEQGSNVISANEVMGIWLNDTDNNHITGNYIGTTLNGLDPLGNGHSGISITDGSSANTIGIDSTGLGNANIISANSANGIGILGSNDNVVAGNYIGTNNIGTTALGNDGRGIYLDSAEGNVIGTNGDGVFDELEGNLISGNGGQFNVGGIYINIAAIDNVVAGNYVGTNFTGSAAIGNNGAGIAILGDSNRIGTNGDGLSDLLEANVISGNGGRGVWISGGLNNQIAGNFIGTDAAGVSPLGNAGDGIAIGATDTGNTEDNWVGGTAEKGNVIAFNQGAGVNLGVYLDFYSLNNPILYNSIFSNAGLGIDLHQFNGVTLNDVGDGDSGANDLINFPQLDSALAINNTINIGGQIVDGLANAAMLIQFFVSPSCDPSGWGEGQTFVGETTQMTDGSGDVSFLANFGVIVSPGAFITATATNAGNTSEFSACVEVFAGANAQLEQEDTVLPPLVIVPTRDLNCRSYCTAQSEVADTLLVGIEYSPIGWDPITGYLAFEGPTFGVVCYAPPQSTGTELMTLKLNNAPITFDQLTLDIVPLLACPAFSTPTPTVDVDEGDNTTETPDPALPECSDGVDNDGDRLIDYSATGAGDPQCRNANDNDELNP